MLGRQGTVATLVLAVLLLVGLSSHFPGPPPALAADAGQPAAQAPPPDESITKVSTLYVRNARSGLNGKTDAAIYSDKTFDMSTAVEGQGVKNVDIVSRFTGTAKLKLLSLNGLHAINRYGVAGSGGGDFSTGLALGGYSEHYGTATVTGGMFGGEFASTIYGTGATITAAFGSLNTGQVGPAGKSTVGTLHGSEGLARIFTGGTGTVQNAYGAEGIAGIWPGGAGSITTAIGGRFWVNHQAGTITNAYAIQVPQFSIAGGKTAYGLYIDGPSGAAVNQALRVNSGTSYFAGGVALGSTIEVAKKAVMRDSLTAEKGISVGGGPLFSKVLADSMSRDFDLRTEPYQDLTLTVRGAQPGDMVALGVPAAAQVADVQYTAFVSSPNTVTIRAARIRNTPNPPAGVFKVAVFRL